MSQDDRYHRQKIIPNWDQQKLDDTRVLVLGVGAIGSYLATNLSLTGIGEMILCDFDTIELSNLNRQLLFTEDDLGRNKAEVAVEKLSVLNPRGNYIPFSGDMKELPKSLKSGNTVIASCLDTFRGRRWANSLALNEKTPMITGGMYAFLGNIQTIIPYETACFECQPLISQEKLSQACSPLGEKRKKIELEKEEIKLPSVSTLSSIVSGIMSQEILKVILGIGKVLDNYLFYDGLHNSFTSLQLERNKNCPICGENYKFEDVYALVFPGENVGDFKRRIALAYGMADPQIMYKGKFLREDKAIELKQDDKIFVIDERLAAPISMKIKLND